MTDVLTENKSDNQKKSFTMLIESVLLFLVIFIVFLLTLNYFNILSISSIYSNIFGFLPHKPLENIQTVTKNIPSISLTNNIPLDILTITSGELDEYPTFINNKVQYYISAHNPTILSKEIYANDKNKLWVSVSFAGDKLTRTFANRTVIVNGKPEKEYKYEGLTVWYLIDNNTVVRKNDPKAQGGSKILGMGINSVINSLKPGATISGVISSPNSNINNKSYNLLRSDVGKIKNDTDKAFEFNADVIIL